MVLGLALRSMIADFFSDIALNLERSFAIRDHIQLETGSVGEVIAMNWRTTALKNFSGNYCTVPNSTISAHAGGKFPPTGRHPLAVDSITLDFAVPIPWAERILAAAVTQAQAIIGRQETPLVLVREITEHGVQYIVVYAAPGWPRRGRSRAEVLRSMMHNLTVAGIHPVHPQYDIHTGDVCQRQLAHQQTPHTLLQRVPLLRGLDDTEVAMLARRVQAQRCPAGAVIVEQGATGASMYIVA